LLELHASLQIRLPGTIEFRLPPGVETRTEAEHWIAYTLTFAGICLHSKDCLTCQRRQGGPEVEFGEFKTYMEETHKTMGFGGALAIEEYRVEERRALTLRMSFCYHPAK
jgi:hypothetical protein